MNLGILPHDVIVILEVIAYALTFLFASFLLWLITVYLIDKTQKTHAIRRNFPVIGRLRYYFEDLGVFFRQYFAKERDELPFNRAMRSWVYRSAKDVDSTIAFGSTRDITKFGSIYFANSMYPLLHSESTEITKITIGQDTKNPYTPDSFFNISAMSFGALSVPAVRALSNGARMAGVWLNTGEGGLAPYHLEGGGDIVFQIGTAMFGVCDEHGNLSEERLRLVAGNAQVKMIEIKLSQGAKPGKGGILPGSKVTEEIAKIRNIPVGKDAISPNRYPNVKGPDDLIDMINHIRDIAEKPVGIKLCVGNIEEVKELFETIKKRGIKFAPDFMTIDSGTGGTGAAPMSLIDNVGLPITESLPQVINLLQAYGLRERIKVIASGKLVTPVEVAWALAIGADFINSARGFMFALGCIQALQCNRNTCPTGITTHNKKLQYGLDPADKAVRVANYVKNMKKEVEIIAHSCGVSNPRELTRKHMRILTTADKSVSFDGLY